MTTNLLIFDLKIKDIDILLKSVNSNTKYVLIDYYTDTFELLTEKIKNLKIDSLNSVGLIREEYFSTYYKLFENQEPFILQSVYDLDRELKTWEPMVNFIIFLKENFNLQIFDFISCNLYNYTDYKYIFNILSQKTNIEIGASKQKIGASGQKIGNLEYNILNLNTKNIRNLKEIYFTDYINNYTGTFGATFVLTIAPAVPITYYSTSVKLNLTYGTALLPGVNSSWKRVNTISGSLTISGNVNKYFMLSNTYGFAVANNSVTKSIDGGITWSSVTKPFNMQISDVYAWDQNNFIIWGNPNGSTSKIFKTIDGGTSWLDISGGYNSGNIYSMAFLNDIGYIGIANNIYRSTNYGYSWVNLNHSIDGNPKKILMVSTLIIYIITTRDRFYYSTDGGITFSNITGVSSTDIATTIEDPSIIFSVVNEGLRYATLTLMVFGFNTTPASSSINSILMPNNTTFYLFTTANYLYSVNNRSTWNTYTYNITTTLSKFSINDYSIYGLGADNNLYRLYISYPGTLNYYSNNTLIKSYTMNKLYENNVYLSNLYLGNNNIYAYYVSNDTIYDSISSSIITLNVQQYAPYIYTNNTISGIIDHNYSIKLFTTTSSLIYETNTFFIQINKTPICQGTPFKISMVTNQIGFSCSTNGLLGKTIDGGITWSIIDTGLSYITNTKNKILDIFATDISNILLVTRNNIYRSYDSCVNWTLTLSNVVNILSATSINETFCYTNGTNTYYSTDFGQTFPFIFSTGNQISVHFGIKSFILWGKSNDIGYINDGIVATNNISSFTSSNVYSYDRSFGVSYNSTQVYLVTNNGTYYQIILTSTYLISFVIIVDSSTIFVATYSNTYYVSRNKGTNWATNTIQSPIIHFCKVNYGLYAICQDGNLYLLYLSYPGTINIYDNNNLLSSYKNNNAFNFSTFLLPTKNYSIYSIFVPDYSDYTTISSNVLNINIPQPKLSINTYNSISGIVNYNRSTKILYKTTFLPVIYDVNINFVKVNIQQTGIGGPIRIKMMTSKFGFISFMGSSISMTIDGCITWKIIDVNLSYYKSTRNRIRIIDLHAWDISNIMVGGGNRLAKTFDGGMSWYDISGSFNNDTNILSLQFFDETGYLLSNSNLYKTSNYGLTWIKILVLPSTPTLMSALNRSIIYVCYSDNYYSYSYNSGLTFSTPFTSGIGYKFINVFDENNVTFHNNGSIGLIINKETRSFYKTFSTIDFFFSSIYMIDLNTIIAFTTTNFYYISYDKGSTWSIYYLQTPIINANKIGNLIFAVDENGDVYQLILSYPGLFSIYDNNGLIQSLEQNSLNIQNIGFLNKDIQYLYAQIEPTISNYNTISSNIIQIKYNDTINIYTNYTLSGIINHGSTIKLYNRFSSDYLIEYNTNFIKYNQTNVVNGQPLKIIMVNSNLGFICGTGGSVSRTLDGGLSWLNLNSISYYSTVNYQPIDIFAWDISNIIVAGGNRIHKSFDGGNNWIDISGVYNTSNYIVSGMMFIDETGIITFNNYTNCFRSINYGLTWSLYINVGNNINNFYMYSKLVHVYGKTNQVAYVSDGITYTNYGNGNKYSICYIYNPLIYVAYFNNTTIHVFINNILVSTSLTPAYTVTSIIMSNENTIIVSTNSNYYYVSYNLGTTWSIFSLPVVITYMYKKDYSIYGLGQDNNLYVLYTTYPGTIQIYGNDTNLLSYKNDSFFNFNILGYLSNGSYNLYALFVPENSSYLSISSNILNIIVNQIPSIYTNYTLSGIINHGSSIKLFFNNINYIPEGTSFFIKLNTNSVINGTVKKIKMTNNDLGFAIDLFSNISITTNGGITWNTIVLNIPYFYSNSLADIYGWDINNIIIGGGKKVYKTNDGGITWYEIIIPDIRGIVTSIAFIEETGYLGDSAYYIYRSFDYGLSWSPLFVIGSLTNIIMYNKYFVIFCKNWVDIYYTIDGITLKSRTDWALSNTCFIYDPQLIVIIYISWSNRNLYSIYLFNSIKETFTLKYSTTSFVLTSVILVNENTIIVGTNTNNYLISYDLGNNWIVANFISPIIQLIKNNNKVYALCQNGNIYILYCTVPYIYSIYDNNNLLLSGNLNDNTNFTFLSNLQSKSYSLYSLFTPINSNFITLSSNLLNINVNQGLMIYTLSSTINLYSTRIFYKYNNPLLYDYTTHFIKLNNTSLMISGIKKVRMTNPNLGYACGLGGTISRTTDGGITWNYLTLSYNIYVNGTNSLIDIYGYDISNIITIGNKYMYKTRDGGKTWTSTIAFDGNTVTSMYFINKKGFVGVDSKIYETNDFGDSWNNRNVSGLVNSIYMYSSRFIVFGTNSWVYKTYDGLNYSYVLGTTNKLFIYNPTIGASLNDNMRSVYYISNNFNSTTSVLTAPGDIVFTDVTMISENIIIVTTSTNKYYISYNKGTSWFINTLIVPLISMQNLGYCVIAVGYDDNLYILQTSPGLTTIKNNDSSETFYFNSFANSKTIKILGNSSLQIIQNNNQSISSNILYLTVSDYYSIYSNSNIINYENQIKINKTTNINGLINSNMFFTKINSSTINSYPTGIKVYDSSSIFVFNINGYMSKSFDAGVTWSDIPLNLQLFNAINYSGFDIIDKYTYIIFDTSRNNNITGVLKTTDGGNSWINSNGVFVNNATYSCTCITFLNNIGFMGTTNGALLKSFDGGSNWVTLFNINNSSYLINVIKIINENLIFVGHNSGYFYTDGLSNSYTNTNPGIVKYIDNYDSNLIFFANDNTVYKTVNASTSITTILSIPSGYVTSISILSNYLLVSLNTNYYYVSMDFGTTWSYFSFESSFLNIVKFNNAFYGITYDGNLYSCIIDPLETTKVYDNGVELIPSNYPLFNLSISCLQKLYSLTIITTNINTEKERRYSTDILHLPNYSSTVPVNTFTNFSLNKYYSNNEDIITANCDTTAFYNELQLNNNITNINFYDVSNGIACSFINGIFITQNSGLSWIYKESNLGIYITSTFIIELNKILATTNDGTILQSVDFGTSWSIIYQTYKSYLKNIYFVNSLFGAVCGYTNNILITLDGGITFLNSYTGTTSYFNKVFITSISGTIYAVGTNNTIIRSYNNGLTWNNIITTPLIEIYFDINMYDENIGFVVGSDGYVLKTTDSFITYKLYKLSSVAFKCVLIYDINTILVGGYSGLLYLSTDGGNSWAPIGSGTRNSINYFNKIKNVIRFGFNGGISKLNYLSNQIYSIIGSLELLNTPIYNLNSIFAWYEPNNIVIINGYVSSWNSTDKLNNLTYLNGSLSLFKYENLQMLSLNTNTTFISLTNNVYLGGFICIVYFNKLGYNYLFATSYNNDNSQRSMMYGGPLNSGDIEYGISGLVSINGTTVYDYSINQNNYLYNMNNYLNTYMIVYVKFSNTYLNTQMTPSIGSMFQGRGFTGYIGDFIFLKQNHTQDDRILIENYLANKWNLTSKFINPYNPVINSSYFINKIDFSTILNYNSYNLYNVFTPGSSIYNYSVSLSSTVIIKPKLYVYGQPRYYDTTSSVILMLSGVINNNVVLFSYNAYYQNANAENNKLIFYNNLVLIGELNSYFSYPSSSGTTIGNILQKPINVDFVFHDKIYDSNTNATLSSYIISNFYLQDTIDIQSNNIISILRNKNIGYQILDISNIVIIGSTNYFAPPQTSYINIFQKLVTPINTNIYYSSSYESHVTLSGLVNNDFVYLKSSLLPSTEIGIYDITISNYIDDNPVTDALFYYTFNIDTIYGYYIQNQYYIKSYNAQIYNSNNFIDSNNQKLGSSCLYLSNSSYIKINDYLTITNKGVTFSLWVRTIKPQNYSIFDFDFIKLYVNRFNNFSVVINNITISSNIQCTNNTWNNIIFTINSFGSSKLYLNGNNILTTSGLYYYPNVYSNLLIGTSNISDYYEGFIDDFRFYNRVLENFEINMLSNSPFYSFSNLNLNYILSTTRSTNTIIPKPINIYTENKTYDGNNLVYFYTLSGIINNDILTLCGIVYYNDINVGYNSITVSGFLYGIHSYRYFIQNTQIFSYITKKNIIPLFNFNKIYDNTYITKNVTYTLPDVIYSDIGTIDILSNYSSIYLSKYPTISGIVNVTNLSLYGSSINNYTIQNTLNYTGIITPKPYIPAEQLIKIYDGTNRIKITIAGLFPTDDIIGSYAYFDDKNTGINKQINNTSISDVINYVNTGITVIPTPVGTAINSNIYTITGLTGDQAYQNGTYKFSASSNNSDSYRAFLNDTGIYAYTTATVYSGSLYVPPGPKYDGNTTTIVKDVGIIRGEYIQVQFPFDLLITSFYYTPPDATSSPWEIDLVGSIDGINWILINCQRDGASYLRKTSPLTYYSYFRLIIKNVIAVSYCMIYLWKIDGKIKVPGTEKYIYTPILPFYGNILPFPLNYSFTGLDKTYDGTNLAQVNKYLTYINGDDIDLSFNSFFNDSNAGYNKLISVYNVQLIGTDSSNYSLSYNSDYTFGTIYQKPLYVLFNNPSKTFDGNNSVILTYTLSGIIINDTDFVDICNNYIAYYSSINIGTNIPIIVSGLSLYGLKSINYTPIINQPFGIIN